MVRSYNRLIMVPCNAVYFGNSMKDAYYVDKWASILRGKISEDSLRKEIMFYNEHADAGVEEAHSHKKSILIFAGGKTIYEARFRSEGESYGILEQQKDWLGHRGVEKRCDSESYSRDSYENLIGSEIVFRQLTGRLPEKVTIVGYAFKKERFRFHAETLGIKMSGFRYVGVNNLEGSQDDPSTELGKVTIAESKTLEMFKECPFGNSGALQQKREQRDIFNRGFPYREVVELENLIKEVQKK